MANEVGLSRADSDAIRERLQIIAATMFLLSGKRTGRRQRKLVIRRNPGSGKMEIPDSDSPFASGKRPWVVGEQRTDTEFGPMIEAIEWLSREQGVDWIMVKEIYGFFSFPAGSESIYDGWIARSRDKGSRHFKGFEVGERQHRGIIDAWQARFGSGGVGDGSRGMMSREMMDAIDCCRAKAKHPDLKPENVRRLIDAIRAAVPRSLARQKPLFAEGGRPMDRDETMARNAVVDPAGLDSESVRVCFSLSHWIDYVGARGFSRHSCGTAACISGFAHIMLEGDRGKSVRCGKDLGQENALKSLAEFVGVERPHALNMAMCRTEDGNDEVQPRHAVALLERFLDTGEIDWMHAMGRVKNWGKQGKGKTRLTEREEAMRARERALVLDAQNAANDGVSNSA